MRWILSSAAASERCLLTTTPGLRDPSTSVMCTLLQLNIATYFCPLISSVRLIAE